MVLNELEYMVISPFETIFRKLGKWTQYLFVAFAIYFIFMFLKVLTMVGFNYEDRMFLVYSIFSIMLATFVNLIKTWLTSRRYELAKDTNRSFQYKFIDLKEGWNLNNNPDFAYTSNDIDEAHDMIIHDEETKNNEVEEIRKQVEPSQNMYNIPMTTNTSGITNAEEVLENLIGLDSVKQEVLKLKLKLELEKKKKAQGIEQSNVCNMHMFFTGNPGTGKTTVARIITGILYNMGYIKENKCIECGKQDIVGQYLGESAQKTNAVIQKALGGVLFIDEAYSLCENYNGDGFAKESVEVILKSMEDNRDNLIVIFAGYTKEMKEFKKMNPGLKSRIGMTIEFPDYTSDELVQIFVKKSKNCGYKIQPEAMSKIQRLCTIASKQEDFGNGRFVENLFREIESNHAITTANDDAMDERIVTILSEDVTDDILERILD